MLWKLLRGIYVILGITGLVFAGWLIYTTSIDRQSREGEQLKQARFSVLHMVLDINGSVTRLVNTTRQMAGDLTNGKLSGAAIERRLRLEAKNNSSIQAIGVAFEPNVFKADKRLYAPYYVSDSQGAFQMVQLGEMYDYLDPPKDKKDWYAAVSQLQGTWSEPVEDIYTGEMQVLYAVTFYRFDQHTLKQVPAGAVFIALALEDFRKLVKALDLGDEGYAYIISGQGNYLVHPDPQLTNESVLDHANRIADTELAKDVQKAVLSQLFLRDGFSGSRPCWFFYEPIPAANWSLGIVLQKDPRSAMVTFEKYAWVKIGIILLIALTFLAIFIFNPHLDSLLSLWAVPVSVTLLMLAMIAFIWYQEIISPSILDSTTTLSSQASLTKSMSAVDEAFTSKGLPPPIRILTGIFIESIAIDGSNITFTGYLWQKYPQALVTDADSPTVVFSDAQDESQENAFRFTEKGLVTIGYYFRVTQRQTSSSTKYPLDQEIVSLRLQPSSLDKNFLLVPDLDSYSLTGPSTLPGLKPGVLLSNWNILRSAFSYRFEQRGTNFGSEEVMKKYNLPDLEFDITLQRFILSSMLSYGITVIVIAILMFSLIMAKAEKSRDLLTESFALFFVLVVAHVGLRNELAAQSVVYLETMFIMLYCLILLGVLNGFLEFVDFKVPLFSYRDGLLFKLLYWPILFGTFLIVSLSLFYPNLF